jgi:hypothetical protein
MNTFYCIRPRLYRVIEDGTKARMSREDRRALKALLKKHLKNGENTKFKTEQDGLDALSNTGLSLDDYSVNEVAPLTLGW